MEEKQATNQNALKIGVVLLLAALGLLGYLYYGAQNKNVELGNMLNGKVNELSSAKTTIDSISTALDAKIAEVTALGGSVAELEKVKAQLEQDKKSLRNGQSFSAKKYEAKIKEYQAFLAEKDLEIAKLKEENGILITQNQTLETEKQSVISENTGLKTTYKNTKDSLTGVVNDVSTKNQELANKVKVGSALKAVNVQIAAISSRGRERTGTVRNRKIDQLKVSFILPSNQLTETANKDIYVRLTDPEGGVINDMAKGGVLNYNNQEIGYSTKQTVLYNNNDQKVDILYKKEQAMKSGKYSVELYSEGFKIGTGSFAVK
jgi:predicted  nucleic acid-binding Zn-ribbon protein